MKKLLLLVAVFTTICITKVSAQGGNGGQPMDSAARAQRMAQIKDGLAKNAKLSPEQVDKVMQIQSEERQKMGNVRDLDQDARQAKMKEMQDNVEKRYTNDLHLTAEQVKAINDFYQSMRRPRPNGN